MILISRVIALIFLINLAACNDNSDLDQDQSFSNTKTYETTVSAGSATKYCFYEIQPKENWRDNNVSKMMFGSLITAEKLYEKGEILLPVLNFDEFVYFAQGCNQIHINTIFPVADYRVSAISYDTYIDKYIDATAKYRKRDITVPAQN